MSRSFNGTTDRIVVAPSGSVPINQGNFTVMALVKPVSNITNDHWITQGYNSSNGPSWGLLETGAKFYNEGNFGGGNGTPVLNQWMWVCYSKASGSVKPDWYFNNLTAGSGWSHVQDGANVGDQSGPPVGIVIGGKQPGSNGWQGSIAALAVFSSVLTQTQIQNAAVSALTLKNAGPAWGALLYQTSTATDVLDLSGNGATQSSITGTSIDADEPPGWNYSLVSSPSVKVWNGTSEVDVTVSVWDGATEVAASVSSIA